MIIEILDPEGDGSAWDEFVDHHPGGLFFHRANWRQIIKLSSRYRPNYLLAKQGSTIVGVLPICLVKRPFVGRALISNPFCVSGGPLSDSYEVSEALLAQAVKDGKKFAADYIEVRDFRVDQNHKDTQGWDEQTNFATFKKTLSVDHRQNLKEIPNRQRAVIRKAQKLDLEVTHHRDLERFLRVYGISLRNLGTPIYPRKYFERLLQFFPEMSGITTISRAGIDFTSVLSFYYKGSVLPYYGGGIPKAREYHSYPYMYWELMCHAVERGYMDFDFGRSPVNTGAYAFKKNLGFEAREMIYSFQPLREKPLPNLTHDNDRVRLLTQLWSKLPVTLTNRIGPMGAIYAV